jgi:hypothetical protein
MLVPIDSKILKGTKRSNRLPKLNSSAYGATVIIRKQDQLQPRPLANLTDIVPGDFLYSAGSSTGSFAGKEDIVPGTLCILRGQLLKIMQERRPTAGKLTMHYMLNMILVILELECQVYLQVAVKLI